MFTINYTLCSIKTEVVVLLKRSPCLQQSCPASPVSCPVESQWGHLVTLDLSQRPSPSSQGRSSHPQASSSLLSETWSEHNDIFISFYLKSIDVKQCATVSSCKTNHKKCLTYTEPIETVNLSTISISVHRFWSISSQLWLYWSIARKAMWQ